MNAIAPARRRSRRSSEATVKLEDVARLAGVSTASVSRALNLPQMVSAELRLRVAEAMRQLNWVPNGAAKALASLRSRTIGIMIPTLGHQNFATLIESLQRELGLAQYTLILGCDGNSAELRVQQLRKMIEQGIECLVLVGEAQPPELFALLDAQRVPYVITYTSGTQGSGHVCIGFDNHACAVAITRHLLELGHRNFGMVAHMREGNDRIQQRIEGARATLSAAGIAIRPQHLVHVDSRSIAGGREGMRLVLADGKLRPTALICTNDYIATGAMIEAKAMGLRIPEDLSIVGFDDTDMSAHLDPPLTTIRVPSRRMGEEVARYIIQLLDGTAPPPAPPGELPAELVVRGSTAPPRG